MDRVEAWLMTCETRLRARTAGAEFAADARVEACHAVETLEAVGALSPAQAERWRRRFAEARSPAPPAASPDQHERAEALMRELLEASGGDPEEHESALHRFEGASLLLTSTGLIDGERWDRHLRQQVGWPSAEEEAAELLELNRRSGQAELLSVIAGPPERRRGFRVLFGLRFSDGMSFAFDCDGDALAIEWPEWVLRDSEGREYMPAGGGGSEEEQHHSFRGAPPPEAEWIELELEDHPDVVFRMAL